VTAAAMISALLNQIPRRFPGARVWRQNSGALRDHNGRPVKFGVPGCADISGIWMDGRRIELEIKAGKDKLREAQVNWGKMIRECHGIFLEVRDVEGCLSQLEKYR
jgi:hypothetical protein